VRTAYQQVTDVSEVPGCLLRLDVRTAVLDIEPLVATWDSSQAVLDSGLQTVVAMIAAVPGVRVLCFATNSDRLPSARLPEAGVRIEYLTSARKPLRTGPYLRWPRPGAVVGDQVATDGLLARRLGYAFVHYRPRRRDMPPGPLLLSAAGDLVRPFFFTSRERN